MSKRKIKFRAWDTLHKGFINGFNMIGFSTGQGAPTTKLQRYSQTWQEPDSYILEQYIGIGDINGKEIYEGDIIRLTEETDLGHAPRTEKFIVEFNQKEVGYQFDHTSGLRNLGGHYIPLLLCMGKGEIIGNIHQNPEIEN